MSANDSIQEIIEKARERNLSLTVRDLVRLVVHLADEVDALKAEVRELRKEEGKWPTSP